MQDPLKKIKGKRKVKIPVDDALGAEQLLNCLSQWAKEKKKGEEALTVAVVGIANVTLFLFVFLSSWNPHFFHIYH